MARARESASVGVIGAGAIGLMVHLPLLTATAQTSVAGWLGPPRLCLTECGGTTKTSADDDDGVRVAVFRALAPAAPDPRQPN